MSVPKTIDIAGTVQCWNLGDTPVTAEEYIVVNTNYSSFRQLTKPYLFSAQDGEGEQRMNEKPRVRHMRNAFEEFTYTPTVCYAGVREDHKVTRNGNAVTITIDPDHPLPLTDASHRNTALQELRLQGGNLARKVDNLPITLVIHLDPTKTKRNFINLQNSCKVNTGQLLTMKITSGEGMKKSQQGTYKVALDIAKTLHTTPTSHLFRLVKFDTQSGGSLPFKTVAQPGKSDLATSIYGTALIAEDYKKDANWAASMVLFAYETLQKDVPELLKKGSVLAPEPDGTIGGSTMIIGLGNMLAGRMKTLDREKPTEADSKWFVKCVKKVFAGEEVQGNFSSQRKRSLMNAFTVEFFRDVIEDPESVVGAHEGIPIFLCLLLGTSAFNVSKIKITKPKGKKGRKKKGEATDATDTTDVVNETTGDIEEAASPEEDDSTDSTESTESTPPLEVTVVEQPETAKVVQSDTDPEWVEEPSDKQADPPWVDDENDEDDPFGNSDAPELDKFR